MEQLKNIIECLTTQMAAQCGDLKKVDAKEMGEVADIIKDLEEACYYCSIIDAMEKSADEKEQYRSMNVNYYMEGDTGSRMYYDSQPHTGDTSMKSYVPYMEYAPYIMRSEKWRDERFPDRSSQSRKMYMESKSSHKDDQASMKELEHYIKDLGEDLTDMVRESTMEERQVLASKLQQLAIKINNGK